MPINDELLEQLLEGYEKPEDLLGEDGILQNLKKRVCPEFRVRIHS